MLEKPSPEDRETLNLVLGNMNRRAERMCLTQNRLWLKRTSCPGDETSVWGLCMLYLSGWLKSQCPNLCVCECVCVFGLVRVSFVDPLRLLTVAFELDLAVMNNESFKKQIYTTAKPNTYLVSFLLL